ncbi:hypothetical protein SCA6_018285 [Theobroma cacao]
MGKDKEAKGKGKQAGSGSDASASKGKGKAEKGDGLGTCTCVKARHILCEKQGKINEAYKKLEDGWLSNGDKVPPAEFAKIAQEYSECPSGKKGGDSGWFPRDQLGILQSAKQKLGIRDMEETTSEVTSPCLTSQMAYGPMYDQLNNALAWNSWQHTNVGIVHSQANQFQLVQGEPSEASEQPRARRCRPKLNEDQRRENKRQCDIKYRLNQKTKVNELTAENKRLLEKNEQFSAENRHLKEENGRLSVKSRHLEEHLRKLKSKGKLPTEDTQRQDSYISQPASQLDHQIVHVQDHHGVGFNYEEAVYTDHHRMDSDIEGAVDGVDGLEINDLFLLENEVNQNGRVAIHECGITLLYNMDARISKLEAELNHWKKKRDEIYEGSKLCIAAAGEFAGVPVSTGLFPQSSCN